MKKIDLQVSAGARKDRGGGKEEQRKCVWYSVCSKGDEVLEQGRTGRNVNERSANCSVCVKGIVLAPGRMN
jgi:hypothetical protein